MASAATDGGPESLLTRVDAAAALVAALPEEERRARRDCTAVLSDLRALATLRTDAPAGQLLTALRAAAAAAQSAGSRRLRRRAVSNLALVEALEGHLTRAAELAGEAEESAAEDGAEEAAHEPTAATALAWVHIRRYALVEAREWLGRPRTREGAAGAWAAGHGPLQAVMDGQHLRLRHDYELAEQCLGPHLRGPRLPRWVAEQVVTEMVRLAIARGHVDEGLAILQDTTGNEPWSRRLHDTVGLVSGAPASAAPTEAEPTAILAAAVEAAVIRACQLLKAGRVPAAAEQL